MDSEIVLVSTTADEMNPELVEVFENQDVVIDSGHFELTSSIDLGSEVIETATLQLIDGQNEQQAQLGQHLYAVVCTDSNGDVVEEVTVNGEHNSVIEITVDDSLQLPVSDVIDEPFEATNEVKVHVNESGNSNEDEEEGLINSSDVEIVGELFNETISESVSTITEADDTVQISIEENIRDTFTESIETNVVETFSEVIEEPSVETFNATETVEPVGELMESMEISKENTNDEPKEEIKINMDNDIKLETTATDLDLINGVTNGEIYEEAVVEKSQINTENDFSKQPLDDTALSAGEADTTLNTTDPTSVLSTVEGETQDDDKFVIDTSQPIELKVDSIIVINGRKSIIQNHPEKEGELVAYPIRESLKNRKRRGRPRKQRQAYVVEDEEEVEEKSKPEEEKTEKGFVQMADASGAVVKRSARKRKRASHLDEYETGLAGAASDNESVEDDDDAKMQKPNVSFGFRGRGRGRGSSVTISGRGRGRGRPRRFIVESEKVETPIPKPLPKTQPQQQAYLVQMADGRTVVIQVPVTGLAEGMTSQSLAMSVAEALSSGQSSGVLNISVQRGSGSTVTTEKIEIKKNEKGVPATTNTTSTSTTATSSTVPATSSTTTNSVSTVASAPAPSTPLSVIPIKSDSSVPIGLKASNADLSKFRCSKCQYQGYFLQQLNDHLMTTHSNIIEKCKLCSFVTLEKDKLIAHFKEKHPKCICPTCNFLVDQPFVLRKHMQKHLTSNTTCTVCGKSYKDRYVLQIHMRTVHMPAKVLFECPLCIKKFSRKAHLVRHLRTHDPEKPYKCSQCDYRGTEKSDVTKHSLIHEEPKHSCEVCGHSFRHLRNMEIHMKRHIGQKDYKCGVCDFSGYTFTDIRKHIERKHSADPNTLVCTKCGQAFLDSLQLADHVTTGQCELYVQETALLDAEELPVEDESEMEVDSTDISPDEDPPSIHLSEDSLSVVVNSSELMDIKSGEEEVLADCTEDVNCEPQTISLVSDGVEFDGSHGLLTLLSEDGQVIRGIILDSGELETQVENTVVLEEVS